MVGNGCLLCPKGVNNARRHEWCEGLDSSNWGRESSFVIMSGATLCFLITPNSLHYCSLKPTAGDSLTPLFIYYHIIIYTHTHKYIYIYIYIFGGGGQRSWRENDGCWRDIFYAPFYRDIAKWLTSSF